MPDYHPSITLFGGFSNFTLTALKQLIERNLRLKRVVLSAFGPSDTESGLLPQSLFHSRSSHIIEICRERNLPITYSLNPAESLESTLSDDASDVFLLACYPRFMPESVYGIANWASINLHPSLLPRYKGSNPIFWQLRNGESDTGVTLHHVTPDIDAGDIVASRRVAYPAGSRFHQIEQLLIEAGIQELCTLVTRHASDWTTTESDPNLASWQPPPCHEDFTIHTSMRAETVYNFTRAYATASQPIQLVDQSTVIQVTDAVEHGVRRKISHATPDSRFIECDFVDGYVKFLVENIQAII